MKKGINDEAFIKEAFAGRVKALIRRSIKGKSSTFNTFTLSKKKQKALLAARLKP